MLKVTGTSFNCNLIVVVLIQVYSIVLKHGGEAEYESLLKVLNGYRFFLQCTGLTSITV